MTRQIWQVTYARKWFIIWRSVFTDAQYSESIQNEFEDLPPFIPLSPQTPKTKEKSFYNQSSVLLKAIRKCTLMVYYMYNENWPL